MSDLHLIRHCSPTLAGLKTGNIFSCDITSPKDLTDVLREFNLRLKEKGLRVLPIRCRDGKALIYVFRPSHLERDLFDHRAQKILSSCGYGCIPVSLCIKHLMRRLNDSDEFPHEIGLFLGYPPEDVDGFMTYGGEGCKCSGHWKVYGDVDQAQKLFAKYKKCSSVYARHWAMGKSIEKLTVPCFC